MTTADRAFEVAMQLPEEDRVALIGRLLDTMPARDFGLSLDSPDLLDELDRRFADQEGEIRWADLCGGAHA